MFSLGVSAGQAGEEKQNQVCLSVNAKSTEKLGKKVFSGRFKHSFLLGRDSLPHTGILGEGDSPCLFNVLFAYKSEYIHLTQDES